MKDETLSGAGVAIFILYFSGILPNWFYWGSFALLGGLLLYAGYLNFKETKISH